MRMPGFESRENVYTESREPRAEWRTPETKAGSREPGAEG